MDYIREFMEMK